MGTVFSKNKAAVFLGPRALHQLATPRKRQSSLPGPKPGWDFVTASLERMWWRDALIPLRLKLQKGIRLLTGSLAVFLAALSLPSMRRASGTSPPVLGGSLCSWCRCSEAQAQLVPARANGYLCERASRPDHWMMPAASLCTARADAEWSRGELSLPSPAQIILP